MSFIWSPCPIDFTSISHLSVFFNETPPAPQLKEESLIEPISAEEAAKRAAEEAAKRAQEEADRLELIRYAARAGFVALGAAFAIVYNYHSIPPLNFWTIAPLELVPEPDLGTCPADLDVCEVNFDVCPTNTTSFVPMEIITPMIPFEVVREALTGNTTFVTSMQLEVCLAETVTEMPPEPLAVYYPLPDYKNIQVHEPTQIASAWITRSVNTVEPEELYQPVVPIPKEMGDGEPVIHHDDFPHERTDKFKPTYGSWLATAGIIMAAVNYLWDKARSISAHTERPRTAPASMQVKSSVTNNPSQADVSSPVKPAPKTATPPSTPKNMAKVNHSPVKPVPDTLDNLKKHPLPQITITPSSPRKPFETTQPHAKEMHSSENPTKKQPLPKPQDNPPPKDVPLSGLSTVSSQPPKTPAKQQKPQPKISTKSKRPFVKVAEKVANKFPAAPPQSPWKPNPAATPRVHLDSRTYPTLQEACTPKPKNASKPKKAPLVPESLSDQPAELLDWSISPIGTGDQFNHDEESVNSSSEDSTDKLDIQWKTADPESSNGEPITKGKYLAAKMKLIEELLEESGNESLAEEYLKKFELRADQLDSTLPSGYSSTDDADGERSSSSLFPVQHSSPKSKTAVPLSPLKKPLSPSPKRSPHNALLSPLQQIALRNRNQEQSSLVKLAEDYQAVAHFVPKLQQNKELKEKIVLLTEILDISPYDKMLTETTYEMMGNFLSHLDTLIIDRKSIEKDVSPKLSLTTSLNISDIVPSPAYCSPASNPFSTPKIAAVSPHLKIEMSTLDSIEKSSLQIEEIEITLSQYNARIDQLIEMLERQVEDCTERMDDQEIIDALNDEVRLIFNPYIVVVRD